MPLGTLTGIWGRKVQVVAFVSERFDPDPSALKESRVFVQIPQIVRSTKG